MRCFAQGAGNCLSYDGMDDYVDVGSSVINGARTVELWFMLNSTFSTSSPDYQTLIGRDYPTGGNKYYFALMLFNGDGKMYFTIFDASANGYYITSNQTVWNGQQWYHLAAVIDPVNGMMMYIDGIKQTSTNPMTNAIPSHSTYKTRFGKHGEWNIRYFNGQIDEVRIWNTARTETEIRDNMCKKLNGNESGLVGYWRFDEGSGGTAYDASPNGNNGTLY